MITTIVYRSILVMIGFTVFSVFTSDAVEEPSARSTVVIPDIEPLLQLPPIESAEESLGGVVKVTMELSDPSYEDKPRPRAHYLTGNPYYEMGRSDIEIGPTALNARSRLPKSITNADSYDDSQWVRMRGRFQSLKAKCDNLNQTMNERITNANQ